jgi:hypothetical protein
MECVTNNDIVKEKLPLGARCDNDQECLSNKCFNPFGI